MHANRIQPELPPNVARLTPRDPSAEDLRSQFAHIATLATILAIPFETLVAALAEAEVRLQRDRKRVPAACAQILNGHGKKK